jgi:hypothetical protein
MFRSCAPCDRIFYASSRTCMFICAPSPVTALQTFLEGNSRNDLHEHHASYYVVSYRRRALTQTDHDLVFGILCDCIRLQTFTRVTAGEETASRSSPPSMWGVAPRPRVAWADPGRECKVHPVLGKSQLECRRNEERSSKAAEPNVMMFNIKSGHPRETKPLRWYDVSCVL